MAAAASRSVSPGLGAPAATSRLRIALITSSYPRSEDDSRNAGVFVRDVAAALASAGAEVVVLTPQRIAPEPGRPWRVRTFWWPGTESSLTHLDPRHPISAARLGTLVASGLVNSLYLLARERIDYIVCAWAVPSGLMGWAAKRLFGVRYGVWALGSDIWRRRDYPFGAGLVQRVLNNADVLYADGIGLAAEVEAIARKPCIFLPASRSLPNASTTVVPRHAGRRVFLCVARLHRNKGVDVLVEAVGLLPAEQRNGLAVQIFGDGPERQRLVQRVEALHLGECVTLGGYIGAQELSDRLHAADCLVIPSRVESIPILLSDAAQARCPVIATDVGDVGFLVRTYNAGRVIEAESPPALAEALRNFVPPGPEGSSRMAELGRLLSIDRSVAQILRDARGHAARTDGEVGPAVTSVDLEIGG